MPLARAAAALATLLLISACDGDSEPGDTTPDAGPPPQNHLGAWYGWGRGFPDLDQCLVFCENGRLFAGDRPCTETEAGDFQGYYTYVREGKFARARTRSGPFLDVEFESFSGDTGVFTLIAGSRSFADLTFTRFAPTSPMCEDPARTAF
jgi:hypothetical protein